MIKEIEQIMRRAWLGSGFIVIRRNAENKNMFTYAKPVCNDQCQREQVEPSLGPIMGIKSDSETSPDCATRIAQLFGRIAQLGLRHLACATPRIAQLWLRNS